MLPGKKYGIKDFVGIAKRRWWLLTLPPVIGFFVALLYSASLKNTYQSEMLIQIVPQRVPDAYVRSTVTIRTEDRMDSLEAMVKSRGQLEQLIAEFDLWPEERAHLPLEDVVDHMRMAIGVSLVRPGRNMPPDSFYVRFMYGDPEIAARVTTRLGGIFVDQNARDRGAIADATNQFLQTQLTEAKTRLEAHERKMEQFRQRHAGRLPSQSEFNLQAIGGHQTQLQGLLESLARDRDRKLMLERLYSEAMNEPMPVRNEPLPNPAVTDPSAMGIGTAKQQLDLARANLARLKMRMKPEHPDVRRLEKTVRDLEAQVALEASATAPQAPAVATADEIHRREQLAQRKAEIESLDRQIAFKESEEQRLRGVVAEYQQRLESIPGLESEWVSLTRDYETLSEAYKGLLKKVEDSKVAADLERRQVGEQFRVLEEARVPLRPIGPVRLQNNLIGFAIGLALGLVLVALLELRDGTFRTDSDVLDVLALPVLAMVPYVESESDRRRLRWRRRLVSAAIVVAAVSGGYVLWTLQLWRHVV
jgi:polysaccharide chain length determinant protein (PEP-CTERM system associated)